MIKFVSRKERKVANARALKIVRELQKRLKPKYRIGPRVEDVVTYGAGIADDIPSFGVASYLFRRALSLGMMFL